MLCAHSWLTPATAAAPAGRSVRSTSGLEELTNSLDARSPNAAAVPCLRMVEYSRLSFDEAVVVSNNLDGAAAKDPPVLELNAIGRYRGKQLRLRVSERVDADAGSTYRSEHGWNGALKGKLQDQFGRISVAAPRHADESVDLTVCVLDEHGQKVTLPAFEFTFVDIDHAPSIDLRGRHTRSRHTRGSAHASQPNEGQECLTATGIASYTLADHHRLEVTDDVSSPTSRARFCSTGGHNRTATPKDPHALTRDQLARSVSLSFANTACFGVSLSLRCCSEEDRSFLFTGQSSMTPPICESAPRPTSQLDRAFPAVTPSATPTTLPTSTPMPTRRSAPTPTHTPTHTPSATTRPTPTPTLPAGARFCLNRQLSTVLCPTAARRADSLHTDIAAFQFGFGRAG